MPLDPQLFMAFLVGGARRGWAAMFGIITGAMVHRAPAWLQMALLGPLVPFMSIPVLALLIAGADRATARLARFARWLDGLAGIVFLGLGLRLLFGGKPA